MIWNNGQGGRILELFSNMSKTPFQISFGMTLYELSCNLLMEIGREKGMKVSELSYE